MAEHRIEATDDPVPVRLGKCGDGLAQQPQRVSEPRPERRLERRSARRLQTAFAQRQEADREVAAIDGRDIARLERLQRSGVEPVQHMAAIPLQPVKRVERIARARREVAQANMAEIPRSQRGEEQHPDISGRGLWAISSWGSV